MPAPTAGPQQGWFQQMQQAAQAAQRQAVPQLQPMLQALPNLFAGGNLGGWANGGGTQSGRQSAMPGIQGGRIANSSIIDIHRRWSGRYREKLNRALYETQKQIPSANTQLRFGALVFSESKPTRTVELLGGWLTDNGINSVQIPNWSGCDVMAAPEEGEDMDVSQAKQHIDYLITPVENGLTWGPGGQMIACEALSDMAHAADPPQGGT